MPAEIEIARAQDLAQLFLGRTGDRWRHVQAVAGRADDLRPAVGGTDGDLLVAAAWLHDIGYSPALDHSGFHPLDGARYLAAAGHPRAAALVAHHSGARFVAEVRGLTAELSRFPFTEDALTDALTCADQTVGPRGERLAVGERLADTVRRHGREAATSLAGPRRASDIRAAVDRTERRLS